MKEWEYTFDPVSKEEWIRQIEKDLRQRPLESLNSEWWPGEPLMPLIHPVDVQNGIVRLSDDLFKHSPRLAEWIDTASLPADVINQRILEALRQGAQRIILHPDSHLEHFEPAWISDVHLEMVDIDIQPQDIPLSQPGSLFHNIPDSIGIRMERPNRSPSFSSMVTFFKENPASTNKLSFIYKIPTSGIWDIEVARVLNKLLEDLSNWTTGELNIEDFFAKSKVLLTADQQYFKHIIQSRVLHLLWANLEAHYGVDFENNQSEYLECHIEQIDTEPSEHFLIRASMSALAAALSGTSTLCIHHSEAPDQPATFKRANRNIHHLLDLESGMYKGVDPLAGAYAIDFHTRKWTQSIWDRLHL